MEGKAAGELSAACSDLPELRKRLSARMGSRHTAPLLRRRLLYPVVDRLPESKSIPGGKAPVVRMLRTGAAYGSEEILQPRLLSPCHGGNAPPAGMRVVRRRIFGLCRGRTSVLLPELRQCGKDCARRTFKKVAAGFGTQNRKAGQSISSRQREKQSWIVTASASGLYAERPACTQGLTA